MKKIFLTGIFALLLFSGCGLPFVAEQSKTHHPDPLPKGEGEIREPFSTDTENLPMVETTKTVVLKVEQGATVKIKLINTLEIPTTLHSHGVRLDDAFDGVPLKMMGKQKEILPNESFEYTLQFPDAGIFWYHPHLREDYTQEMGMYGNFLVQPTDKNYWSKVDREEFLVIDDFAKDSPFFKDHTNETLMGRFGNIFLINNSENFSLTAKRGEKIRFYITNTANTRVFDLLIDGGAMKLVGGDLGRIEKEEKISHLVLGPAERVIVEMQFEDDGIFPIFHKDKQIGQITVLPEDIRPVENLVLRENPSDYAEIRKNFAEFLKKPADKKLKISMEMEGMGGNMMGKMGGMHGKTGMEGMPCHQMGNGEWMGDCGEKNLVVPQNDDGIEWEDGMMGMNLMSTDKNTKWILEDVFTGKKNMDIDWKFSKNDLVKIEIFNDPNSIHPMQHPIHFHGQRFVVLSVDGKPNENLQWKDTTLIPSGKTVEILLETENVGSWMAHCHIAEHLHSGMMLHFEVE